MMEMHGAPGVNLSVGGLIVLILVFLLVVRLLSSRHGGRVMAGVIGLLAAGFVVLAVFWLYARVEVRQHTAIIQDADESISNDRPAEVAAGVTRPNIPASRSGVRPEGDATPLTEPDETPEEFMDATEPSTSPQRPEWVDAPPGMFGSLYRMVVAAGPYKTREECERELDEKLQAGVQEYAARRLGETAASQIELPVEFVRSHVVKKVWQETIVSQTPSIGSMVQLHVLLGFDREAAGRIDEAWQQKMVARRMATTGVGLGAVLLLLLVAYLYLKADLATQGARRLRLRMAATAMILGVVAVAAWVGGRLLSVP